MMKGLFSIRAKFLLVMSSLLMACVVIYLLIAVRVFRTDKTELIYDLNRSLVSNLSTELETQFSGISAQFKMFALLSNQKNTASLAKSVFTENPEVVSASIYRQGENQNVVHEYVDAKYLETYGLEKDFFNQRLRTQRTIPFEEILKSGESFWNASIDGGTALIGYGRSVVVEDSKGRPIEWLAVVGYIQPAKLLKSLESVSLSEVMIVDEVGRVLIHKNPKILVQQADFAKTPLFEKAQSSQVALSVATLKDEGGEFLGAFAKSYHGRFFILSQAAESKAFAAIQELVSRSLLFASIVITISLLFALFLSKSLTEPISILVEGMEKVSDGDLSTQIKVQSRDETQVLATSFNKMIRDLQQSRDDLQEINRELDQKVKDRTRQLEIQNQAVQEAQEALLRTTRLASAGEIAGRAAHEVLNPLTGILSRVQRIEKSIKSEVQPQLDLMNDIFSSWKQDHRTGSFEKLVESWKGPSNIDPKMNLWDEDVKNLDSVKDSFSQMLARLQQDTQFLIQEGNRISKIINGMRKLSNLNSDVQTYSGRKLMIDCRNIMADLFSQADIKIQESYSNEFDELEIDRDEFIQAVTNLMRNSVQAMQGTASKAGHSISLSTFRKDQDLIIQIADTGPGITPEHQAMLFEKQFTTKSPEDGTGIGLGISRRFIRTYGGDIEFVSSVPFEKTLFQIRIPLKADLKVGAA